MIKNTGYTEHYLKWEIAHAKVVLLGAVLGQQRSSLAEALHHGI